MKITLASTYGFCLGVTRAIEIAISTRKKYPNEPIYILNSLVHNRIVKEQLLKYNIITLDDDRSYEDKISSIKKGILIFSAHGHDKKLEELAISNNLITIDTTCPRVKKSFDSIKNALANNEEVFFIGLENHPETLAALNLNKNIKFINYFKPVIPIVDANKIISVFNQTTLIQSELKNIHALIKDKYLNVKIIDDICFATMKRQNALNEVTNQDLIIIIGDKTSSNSKRLYELAKKNNPNIETLFVENIHELRLLNLSNYKHAFISAGASTPKEVIQPIIDYISKI